MFQTPNIFSQFPELISYVGTRDFLLRPKHLHAEHHELQEKVKKLEVSYWFKKAFFLAQCQSSEVIEIIQENLEDTLFADSCITKLQNISLNIVVADCIPILLYDKKKQIIWAIHAGWRGSSEKILQKTISLLQKKHESLPEDIHIFIWPSICGNCYEVGQEVTEHFPNSIMQKWETYFLDLKWENLRQAIEKWILRENIEISDECTFELLEKYPSYRREKSTERFISGISLLE